MTLKIPDSPVTWQDLKELPNIVKEYYHSKLTCTLKPIGIRNDRSIIWECKKETNNEK
jgi:hypothetical protein